MGQITKQYPLFLLDVRYAERRDDFYYESTWRILDSYVLQYKGRNTWDTMSLGTLEKLLEIDWKDEK